MKRVSAWVTYLQVAPLALVFLLFLVVPIATIIVVSFFDYNTTQIIPAFLLQNYEELLLSPVTWRTYGQTIQFSVITWALTLVIGFTGRLLPRLPCRARRPGRWCCSWSAPSRSGPPTSSA